MMQKHELESLRNDYSEYGIDIPALPDSPFPMFSTWFRQAIDAGIAEPNGMVISTASELAVIRQRTVLMKSFDEDGFRFFTNYTSTKGMQLNVNPNISCLFPWLALHRQVIFTGKVEMTPAEESETYFRSRPRASQISAWASLQSQPLNHRKELENRVAELEQRFRGREVPYPQFWGGYLVRPLTVEFWQGRNSRLHDRVVYSREDLSSSKWVTQLLNP